jgi:mRNA interferase RelE/StbE
VVSPFHVEFTPKAVHDFSRLDKPIAQRILDKIKWLSQNLDIANPEPLSHDLKGKWKLRVGDWRVVYTLDERVRSMVILYVDHRSKVYKK